MKKLMYFLLIILMATILTNVFLKNTSYAADNIDKLESDIYIISEENLIVSRILPLTSIGDVKKSFNVDSSQIHIYEADGKTEANQGVIGTGMKIRIGTSGKTYTACVVGDVNGDGEIKQLEVSKAIKHVVGLEKYQLTGIDAIAIDVSGDGQITQKDVSILIKYVVYGKLDIGEVSRPSSPLISVISGTKGNNDWYTSNVTLKVQKPSESLIPVTSLYFEVSGAAENEGSFDENEGLITIEGEGIYQIKCYSVSQTGVKSLATTQTIKIDKTEPTSAELIATYLNANGKQYTFGTISNQKLYLRTSGGNDNISGIDKVTIEAKGANVYPDGTNTPLLLSKDGKTTIIVKTVNNAGLYTTKEYTVIMDTVVKNPGTIITKLNNANGDIYTDDTWTNQSVYIEVQKGAENVTTTYTVSGANTKEETSSPSVLINEGISTVTIINKDNLGNTSRRDIIVKIDKSLPDEPQIKVSGGKKQIDSVWYTSDVSIQLLGKDDNKINSGLREITYSLKNIVTNESIEGALSRGESIKIADEGRYELSAYATDIAGNVSKMIKENIYIDKTNPNSGDIIFHLDNEMGQVYTPNTWTNKNVYIELINGSDTLSGILSTTYQIEGQDNVFNGPTTITQEGEYVIHLTTKDAAGNTYTKDYVVNIDKTIPETPNIEVTNGSKDSEENEWYKGDVTLKITPSKTDLGGSGYSHSTFEVSGPIEVSEREIPEDGLITIIRDGIYTITTYDYDVAGNKSGGKTITIKTDRTAPQNIRLQTSNVTGKSFHLSISTEEVLSGVKKYEIYIDNAIYATIESNSELKELDVLNQATKSHTVKVKVYDIAGNASEASIEVTMGRLEVSDIDYIEFVINEFSITKEDQPASTGAEFMVSDTSTSDATKYIQVWSSENQTVGKIKGTIRLVRKSGEIVEVLSNFPEDLQIEIAQYSDGSGNRWEHDAAVNMLNTVLTNESTEDGVNNYASINIVEKNDSDNLFTINDEKTLGTKTYTRLIIRQITKDGNNIPFKITNMFE